MFNGVLETGETGSNVLDFAGRRRDAANTRQWREQMDQVLVEHLAEIFHGDRLAIRRSETESTCLESYPDFLKEFTVAVLAHSAQIQIQEGFSGRG